MKSRKRYFVALFAVVIIAVIGAAHASFSGTFLTQVAELEKQIHVTFHTAVSVHDPVNGDTQDVITERVRLAISIFAPTGEVTVVSATSPFAGN
jgi:hypothetical protein